MLNKNVLRAACVCVLLATAGCVTVGRPFPTTQIKAIVVGKTTQSDVQAAYGHPYRTGLEDGDVTWSYIDEHWGLFSQPQTTDLLVRFSADGTVKSYTFNTNQ